MKKTMIASGAISVVALFGGSFFKIMHWPGAGMMLLLGIGILSLLFLPLMFLLRAKETNSGRDKAVAGIGTLVGILLCMSTLFKIMHWPGASILWLSTSAVSIFLFVPIYFFTGIRKPETKVNTVITTIILVGATGLLFSLTSVRKSSKLAFLETKTFYENERLLTKLRSMEAGGAEKKTYTQLQNTCNKLKEIILQTELGTPQIPADFESRNMIIYESGLGEEFMQGGSAIRTINEVKGLVKIYNDEKKNDPKATIELKNSIFAGTAEGIFIYSNLAVLNSLNQLQLFLAASEIKAIDK